MMTRTQELIHCLVTGWIADESRLYGNLSYSDVIDWLRSVDAHESTIQYIDRMLSKYE